jgi:hypothetical protein
MIGRNSAQIKENAHLFSVAQSAPLPHVIPEPLLCFMPPDILRSQLQM